MSKEQLFVGVSVDGLRKNATYAINDLHDEIKSLMASDYLDSSECADLIEKFNEVSRYISCLNCLYIDGEKSFTNMSNLEAKTLKDIDDDKE